MRTKAIPAVVMMIAGFVTCILSLIQRVPTGDFLKDLLIVLILFYILGIIIKQCHLVNQFQIKIQWFSFRESHCFFSSKT